MTQSLHCILLSPLSRYPVVPEQRIENKHVFEADRTMDMINSNVLTALCLSCIYVQYLGLTGRLDLGRRAKSIWRAKLEQRKQQFLCTQISD